MLCARGLAGGRSRWAWLACSPCQNWEHAVRARLGGMLLPLGRHSIINGVAVDLSALPDTQERQTLALIGQFAAWGELFAWKRAEVTRLPAQAGWRDQAVPYRHWLQRFPAASDVSRDAYLRLRGVDPRWVVDTFPVLPKPPSDEPERPPWRPADVGQPAVGEKVGISPGPDGHDVTITAGITGWYTANCREPGCGWQSRSMAFPAVRWQAKRHATNAAVPLERHHQPRNESRRKDDMTAAAHPLLAEIPRRLSLEPDWVEHTPDGTAFVVTDTGCWLSIGDGSSLHIEIRVAAQVWDVERAAVFCDERNLLALLGRWLYDAASGVVALVATFR